LPFVVGQSYHIYTRGVEKRVICKSEKDYQRFQLLLFLCNSRLSVRLRDLFDKYQGEPLGKIFNEYEREGVLVDIIAYVLMPNHLHLILHERKKSGISKFMLKLMTAYSMYFNTKNERSGPLFTRPFRSRHIDTDPYMRWIFAYIHTNPLELHQRNWKQSGLTNFDAAKTFLQRYMYSSFPDYFVSNRPSSKILEQKFASKLGNLKTMDSLLTELSRSPQGEPLGKE